MLRPKTEWVSQEQSELAAQLRQALPELHPGLVQILANRGIRGAEEARRFLWPSQEDLHDPYLMHGMEQAVAMIEDAIRNGEKIAVYGDYDADGVCSTALLLLGLKELGVQASYYIPDRFAEGYGLHAVALRQLADEGIGLVITVDTGITAVEEAKLARELGMRLVITDHHQPQEALPQPDALINPHLAHCSYPFKELAGVGVAFKLLQGLLGHPPTQLLQLVALGTVADLMPLQGENRALVRLGMEEIRHRPLAGIAALCQVAGVQRERLGAEDIAYSLGPRLNASGRMTHARESLELLLAQEEEALPLARRLERLNQKRREMVQQMSEEASRMAEEQLSSPEAPAALVLAREGWNVGLIGIVAARMVEQYGRPSILLSVDPERNLAQGSARTAGSLDIMQLLASCSMHLEHFGGHQGAAGLSLRADQIQPFARAFCAAAARAVPEEGAKEVQPHEGSVALAALDESLVSQLPLLEPFGEGNSEPVFLLHQVQVQEASPMGEGRNHLRLTLRDEASNLREAVAFSCPEWVEGITPLVPISLLVTPRLNEWRGVRRVQLHIRDLRIDVPQLFDWRNQPERVKELDGATVLRYSATPASPDVRHLVMDQLPESLEQLEKALAGYPRLERLYLAYPVPRWDYPATRAAVRQGFVRLYQMLRSRQQCQVAEFEQWVRQSRLLPHFAAVAAMVFLELGFMVQREDRYIFRAPQGSHPLENSLSYLKARARYEVWEKLCRSTYPELLAYFRQLWGDIQGGNRDGFQKRYPGD